MICGDRLNIFFIISIEIANCHTPHHLNEKQIRDWSNDTLIRATMSYKNIHTCHGQIDMRLVQWSPKRSFQNKSNNNSLTCHGKKIGDWSRGTRSGATMTNSNKRPSNNGTNPISKDATTKHLTTWKQIHYIRNT